PIPRTPRLVHGRRHSPADGSGGPGSHAPLCGPGPPVRPRGRAPSTTIHPLTGKRDSTLSNKHGRTGKKLTARGAAYGTSALLTVAGLTATVVNPAAAGPSADLSATLASGSARDGVHVTLVTGDTVS